MMVAHFNSDVSITEVYLHSIQVWQDNLVAYALIGAADCSVIKIWEHISEMEGMNSVLISFLSMVQNLPVVPVLVTLLGGMA